MTHCDRALNRLRLGDASHLDLYALHIIAHSRISDLRKKGYEIAMWRDGDLYMYRLVSEPLSETPATLPQAVGGPSGVSLSVQGPPVPSPRGHVTTQEPNEVGTGAQLSFEATA